MGNSASLEPEEDLGPLSDNLFDLSDTAILCLWRYHPLNAQQVTQAARSIPQSKRNSFSGFYSQEEDSEEAAFAVRLCKILPELAALRFKLVPGRLKENKFWQAVLILFKEKLVDYNARQYNNTYDGDEEEDNSQGLIDDTEIPNRIQKKAHNHLNGYSPTQPQPQPTPPTKTITSVRTANGFSCSNDLERQLKAKNAQVVRLQQQVKELQEALADASSSNDNAAAAAAAAAPNNNKAAPKHSGSWQIDKDSQEFLEYPDEVKESLRIEKQKRLQKVKDEMKFILDSDKVEHSNGKWDCCGETSYHSQCSTG